VYDNPMCTGPACTEESTTCDGNVLEVCDGEDFVRTDCPYLGAVCGQYAPNVQYCIGTGADCANEGSIICNGTRIVRCLGGKEAVMDCAQLLGSEYTCAAVEDSVGCGPKATACNQDYTDHCDGSQVVYCRAGNLVRADCAGYGYQSCAQGEAGPYCQ